MKRVFLFTIIFSFLLCQRSFSQDLTHPGEYMTAVANAHGDMNKKYMAYMSAAAHISRKRKIEKMRMQALESINTSLSKATDLPYYKGDNSLRKSSIDYIKLCYSVFNDDYAKIVNMEEIAEQSYDEMQAFILLQQKTDEKLHQASELMHQASVAFAAKYNVKIVDSKDDLGEKLGEAGKLNVYRNNIYLIFFKCNWQDGEIVKAMNAKKITAVEQGRTSLIRYANEGLEALKADSLKSFAGDVSLAGTCRHVLEFYKKMAETDLPKQLDYFLKNENFEKIKKSFEAKGEPTKQDVNTFNAAVKDINNSMNIFNDINNKVNTARAEALKEWGEAEKSFADAHMPYYK